MEPSEILSLARFHASEFDFESAVALYVTYSSFPSSTDIRAELDICRRGLTALTSLDSAASEWLQQSSVSSNEENQTALTFTVRRNPKKFKTDRSKSTQSRKLEDPLRTAILDDIVHKDDGVDWNDIAGCEDVKMILMEALVLPPLLPDYFTGIRKPLKTLITQNFNPIQRRFSFECSQIVLFFFRKNPRWQFSFDKTLLAKAVASKCKTEFFNVSSSTLLSKYHGESEKMVRHLFEIARERAPSTIFLDEIDAICSRRGSLNEHEASRRVKSELLVQMDGLLSDCDRNVMVIGATNFPWDLDEALRRRMEKRVILRLPDSQARLLMLRMFLKGIAMDDDVDLESIARNLEGYSGADIKSLCRDASLMPMRRNFTGLSPDDIAKKMASPRTKRLLVNHDDFMRALSKAAPSVSKNDQQKYEQWLIEYGSI